MTTLVTLKDGSQVPDELFSKITPNIRAIHQENYFAFYELVEKCTDAGHKFVKDGGKDSKAILMKHDLIDQNENVNENVKKIVLNSLKTFHLYSLKLVNPIKYPVSKL